ncbi:class I SAM-dependent methyltransferase [Bradyrhizobium sp. HKCCYLS20291]|uniref:class I SAM-dependent methyltransferase n=1 Tax=Bradyrhizobium sp. HKCCYLS20291 TaxID=3420766 RepID=UPI003EB7B2A5
MVENELDFAFRVFTGRTVPPKISTKLIGVENADEVRKRILADPEMFFAVPELRLAFEITEIRKARASGTIRLVIGAAGTSFPGWVSTNENLFNLLRPETWLAWIDENSVDAMLSEHVWEHLDADEGKTAATTCYRFLKSGCRLRIAVPDALMPDPVYRDLCKVGGRDGHKVFYDYRSLSNTLKAVGYDVHLLEYFDEDGKFHENPWDPKDGHIGRCRRFDPRNSGDDIKYTSLIVDAIKH